MYIYVLYVLYVNEIYLESYNNYYINGLMQKSEFLPAWDNHQISYYDWSGVQNVNFYKWKSSKRERSLIWESSNRNENVFKHVIP